MRHTNDMPGYYMASGTYVEPLNLKPDQVRIGDIAHHLSNQCRFNGGTALFYSVAEHSLNVMFLLAPDPVLQLAGLMHDASEAYLCDMPRPTKHASGEFGRLYRLAEAKAQDAIGVALALPRCDWASVKHADLVMLATEKRDLLPALLNVEWQVLDGIEPRKERILHPLTPLEARRQFLHHFARLVTAIERRAA